jgi:hypothetical protein
MEQKRLKVSGSTIIHSATMSADGVLTASAEFADIEPGMSIAFYTAKNPGSARVLPVDLIEIIRN